MSRSLDANVCAVRESIVAEALTWIGVPWRHQGRTRDGVDCGGLVVVVGRALELLSPGADMFGYERLPHMNNMVEVCAKWLDRVPMQNERRAGDIVVMRPATPIRWPCHMGMISHLGTGVDGLIHAYGGFGGQTRKKKSRETVIETSYEPWRRRTVAVFSYPGVE